MAPSANFVDLCRICATETQSIVRHFIFEGEGKLRDLSKKIAACLPVKVKEDDRLPKVLCGECVYKLDLLHEFREKSQKTEAYLFTLIDGPASDHHVRKQSSSQLRGAEEEDDDDSHGGGDNDGGHDIDDDDDELEPVTPAPVRRNAQGQICEPEVVIKVEEDNSKGDAAAASATSATPSAAAGAEDGGSPSKRPRRAAANKRPIREDSPSLEAPSSPPPPKRRGRKPKGVTPTSSAAAATSTATPGTSTSGPSPPALLPHDFPVVCQQNPGDPWTQPPKFTLLNRPEITIEPEIVVKQEPPDAADMYFPEPECILKVDAPREKKISPEIMIKPQITITKTVEPPPIVKTTGKPTHPVRKGPWTPAPIKPANSTPLATKITPAVVTKLWDANELDPIATNRIYECQYCDEDFPTLDATVEHIAKKHPRGFNCNFCNEKFCTEQTLNQHKRERHWRESVELLNAAKKKPEDKKEVEVPKPPFKSMMRPPKKGKKFPCQYCRLTFDLQVHLDRHIETRHFEDTKLRELTKKVDSQTIKQMLPQHSHLEPIRKALHNLRAHMIIPKALAHVVADDDEDEDEQSLDGSVSEESDSEIPTPLPMKSKEKNKYLMLSPDLFKTRGIPSQKR